MQNVSLVNFCDILLIIKYLMSSRVILLCVVLHLGIGFVCNVFCLFSSQNMAHVYLIKCYYSWKFLSVSFALQSAILRLYSTAFWSFFYFIITIISKASGCLFCRFAFYFYRETIFTDGPNNILRQMFCKYDEKTLA